MSRKQGMCPLVLQGHERPLTCLKYTRDGELMFSSGLDGNVCCWHMPEGKRLGTYDVKEIDLETTGEIRLPAVFGIDPNHKGTILLVGSTDQFAVFFDVATGKTIQQHETTGPVQGIEFCRHAVQDKFVMAVRSLSSKVSHYVAVMGREADAMTEAPIRELCRIETTPHGVGCPKKVYWGPLDKTLITSHEIKEGQKGVICVWDSFDGRLIKKIETNDKMISSISFDQERSIALTTSRDKKAIIWNVAAGWEKISEMNSDAPLNGGALSPLLSEASKERIFSQETFTTRSGAPLPYETVLRRHAVLGGGQDAKDVTTTGAGEGKFEAQLWNVPLAAKIGELGGHIGPINYVAFMPNGRGFATGGEDGFIRVTDFDEEYFTSLSKYP